MMGYRDPVAWDSLPLPEATPDDKERVRVMLARTGNIDLAEVLGVDS